MAARALGSQQKAVDELFIRNDAVSLCLLINRRARIMRIVDFRAGASAAKRQFVRTLAEREGVRKIYTLVERDEVQTWLKLGFAKEGSIPGFYKRSDAFLMGLSMEPRTPSRPSDRKPLDEPPVQSETRLIAARPAGPEGLSAAQDSMERTIAAAKRVVRDVADRPMQAKVVALDEQEARRAVAIALRSGRALTAFEPFGRDVERRYVLASTRGGLEFVASIESQVCFGNAYLELLQAPRTGAEKSATVAVLRALCDQLLAEGVVSCFALAPSDDVALAIAFLHNGFRRTGLLVDHLIVGGRRKDAILWSRKLAAPSDE
jgi:hypothetical protein